MKNLQYKDYVGSIEYSEDDNVLFGKVQQIKGLLSYEGETISELKHNFIEAIEEYLEECKASNVEPEKPFKESSQELAQQCIENSSKSVRKKIHH